MPFVAVKTRDINSDLQAFTFQNKASKNTCLFYIRKAEFLLRCPAALRYPKLKAARVFGVTHFQEIVLFTSIAEDTVFLLMEECRYLALHTKLKNLFPACSFYAAARRDLSSLRVAFAELGSGNASK